MPEPATYLFERFLGRLPGADVLVHVFRDPTTGTVIHAELRTRRPGGTWGDAYPLEVPE